MAHGSARRVLDCLPPPFLPFLLPSPSLPRLSLCYFTIEGGREGGGGIGDFPLDAPSLISPEESLRHLFSWFFDRIDSE